MLGTFLLTGMPASAALVMIGQKAVNDADGSSIGAVSASQFVEIGSPFPTTSAPASWSSYRFTHWTFNGEPATVYRDPWGRSINPISFEVAVAATATAHYLPTTRDNDGDGLPDWYEIEFFGTLDHDANADSDGDGLALSVEYSGGTSPLYGNSTLEGEVARVDSSLITCNLAGYPTYVLRSDPAGTVNQTATVAPGTVVNVPDLAGNASFAYWLLDGARQQDAWGRALSSFSFTMADTDRVAVAHLLGGDGDGDGVPDAYELRYLGTLEHDGSYDGDGDGIGLLAEYTAGSSPLHANTTQEGGVAWVDSSLLTCNLAGYASYLVRSEPAGTVNQSGTVPPGTVVTVPDLAGNASFAYWTLGGVRQQDAWGRALSTFSFTVESSDIEAVAQIISGDGDGDGVPDAYEQRYYGTLDHDGAADTDGDGIGLLAEYTAGSSPTHANVSLEGGVAWVDSVTIVCDLQAEIELVMGPSTDLSSGSDCDFTITAMGDPLAVSFTIRNAGGTALDGIDVSIDGEHASDFVLTASPGTTLDHHATTIFTVSFTPTAAGIRTANLHVASNDADENPFNLALSGRGLSLADDSDGDGLNDATEFRMSALGFDWQSPQQALVAALYSNAHGAGLYDQTQLDANFEAGRNDIIANPNPSGLYTLNQLQGLNLGKPLLQRNPETGEFRLGIMMKKSTDLLQFEPMPLAAPQVTVDGEGRVEIRFTAPEPTAFFRLDSE